MKRLTLLQFLFLFLFTTSASANDLKHNKTSNANDLNNKVEITKDKKVNDVIRSDLEKLSYSLGLKTGEHYKKQNIEINLEKFNLGIVDGIKNNKPILSEEEINQILVKFQTEQLAKKKQENEILAKENLEAGKKFLEQNKQNKDIKVLPSGLQYKILSSGKGDSPLLDDTVTVNYRGTLLDGTEFDSSYKRNEAATLPLKQLIKGWQEALVLMKPGDKWQLFVPANLAYGEQSPSPIIKPNSTLIFEVELKSVTKAVQDIKANKAK